MGVPVVTLAGRRHASRVGVSLLTTVGRRAWVAATAEEFVEIAVGLAADLPGLARERATLRERMERSPLMDGEGFARHMEEAMRTMWHEWCGRRDGESQTK